jgi:cobalt/nickel transport system permease protein
VREADDDRQAPLMGVMGAFVFGAQMINFAIPGTGSSGHLGGALLLTMLLGPHAALLVIASVLAVQSLFFADGGLLALGCNVINLGFFPAFVAWPLVFRPLAAGATGGPRLWIASIVSAIVGLQLGSLAVVVETKLSGISELPFATFLWLMQPIHLAIGTVEGVATAAVVSFIARARPEALLAHTAATGTGPRWRPLVTSLTLAALALGGVGAWFAAGAPDGLEWSIARAGGKQDRAGVQSRVHAAAAGIQQRSAWLPDYQLPDRAAAATEPSAPWPAVDAGTSLSGIAGGLVVLAAVGLLARRLKPQPANQAAGPAGNPGHRGGN